MHSASALVGGSKPTLDQSQLSVCESRVPSNGDRIRAGIIGTSPPATTVGVGTLTDKLSVVQSPLTARPGCRDVTAMVWAARFEVALLVLGAG